MLASPSGGEASIRGYAARQQAAGMGKETENRVKHDARYTTNLRKTKTTLLTSVHTEALHPAMAAHGEA